MAFHVKRPISKSPVSSSKLEAGDSILETRDSKLAQGANLMAFHVKRPISKSPVSSSKLEAGDSILETRDSKLAQGANLMAFHVKRPISKSPVSSSKLEAGDSILETRDSKLAQGANLMAFHVKRPISKSPVSSSKLEAGDSILETRDSKLDTCNSELETRNSDFETRNSELGTRNSPVTPRVIAAIPCYNTQKHIAEVVAKTKKYVDEVIVIDDGSTDMTAEVARNAGATVISHGKNKKYGEAIKSCFAAGQANNADVLITIDGDGQHNPDEIARFLAPIIKDESDIVIGSRFLEACKIPSYRRFGLGIINLAWNFGAKIKITDTQSGFRAYSRKAFDGLQFNEKGMSISIEIIEKARRMGLRFKEVPITCSYVNNNSTLTPKAINHGLEVAFSIIKIRLTANTRGKAQKNHNGQVGDTAK